MRVSGYQPQYFPRLHYFARAFDSDIFRILDYVQFVRNHEYPGTEGRRVRGKSFQAHSLIKMARGSFFLTVPIKKHQGLRSINKTEIELKDSWRKDQLETIGTAYAKAKHFHKVYPDLVDILGAPYANLAQLDMTTFLWGVARVLGHWELKPTELTVSFVNALLAEQNAFRLHKIIILSETDIPSPESAKDATEWIIAACKKMNADEYYYGGTAGMNYLDLERLKRGGIRALQQNWICKPYRQQHPREGFIENLSIIDLLANLDSLESQRILKTE